MKSILISIKPQWVEKILNGKKNIEIRKSMPKCELPCKVYIYCTKGKDLWMHNKSTIVLGDTDLTSYYLNGVEELENVVLPTLPTCVYLTKTKRFASAVEKTSCLSQDEIYNYLGGKNGYAWYIDNLKIYDKSKELSEFDRPEIDLASEDCRYGVTCPMYNYKKIKRPPQSWCYVEGE